jgi:hypothetical protein
MPVTCYQATPPATTGKPGESHIMPITDPTALAHIVTSLGGTVVEARTFQFTMPLGEVKDAVPRITGIAGVGCRRIEGSDRTEETATGPQTIITLELFNKAEVPKEAPSLLDLMPW